MSETLKDCSVASQNGQVARTPYSALLLVVALVAALLFNGEHIYLLSLSWVALFLMFAYQFAQNEKIRITFDLISALTVLFLLWMLVSLYWHPVPWKGVVYNWRLGLYFIAFISAFYLLKDKEGESLLNALMVVGVIVAALTLFQSFFLEQSAKGLFVNKNNNAAFLGLFLLPIMSLLLFGKRQRRAGLLYIAALSLLFLAVLQVSSRGAFIGLGVAAIMLFSLAIYERKTTNILLVCSVLFLTFLLDVLLSSVELKVHVESYSRWMLWGGALDMFKDASWMGIGNGMFEVLYPEYRNPQERSQGFFVHNDYLQIMLELGIPGIVLLLSLMFTIAWNARKLITNCDSFSGVSLYIGMFAAIVAVSIHSLVTFNLYKAGILIVLGLYSGLLMRKASSNDVHKSPAITIKVNAASVIFVCLLLLISVKPIVITGYADAIADGFIGDELFLSNPDERYQIYNNLWELDSENFNYPLNMAHVYSNSGGRESDGQRKERFLKSRELLHKSRELNPYGVETYLAEAVLLQRFKDIVGRTWNEEAILLSRRAIELNPRLYNAWLRTAMLLEIGGNKDKALEVLLDGLVHIRVVNMFYYLYGKKLADELGLVSAYRHFSHLINEKNARSAKEFNDMVEEYKTAAGKL